MFIVVIWAWMFVFIGLWVVAIAVDLGVWFVVYYWLPDLVLGFMVHGFARGFVILCWFPVLACWGVTVWLVVCFGVVLALLFVC